MFENIIIAAKKADHEGRHHEADALSMYLVRQAQVLQQPSNVEIYSGLQTISQQLQGLDARYTSMLNQINNSLRELSEAPSSSGVETVNPLAPQNPQGVQNLQNVDTLNVEQAQQANLTSDDAKVTL